MLAAAGAVTLRVSSNAPAGAIITLYKDGVASATAAAPVLAQQVGPERAVYRVEVELPGGRPGGMPWLLSNPIYVGDWGRAAPAPEKCRPQRLHRCTRTVPRSGGPSKPAPRATGRLDVIRALPGTQLLVRYALSGAAAEGPYVAVAVPAGPTLPQFEGIAFMAHADRPMRFSVQLRAPAGGASGQRWRRSVYLDETPRQVFVPFAHMTAVEEGASGAADLAAVRSVLFVVDTVNLRPGDAGQFWFDEVRYVK